MQYDAQARQWAFMDGEMLTQEHRVWVRFEHLQGKGTEIPRMAGDLLLNETRSKEIEETKAESSMPAEHAINGVEPHAKKRRREKPPVAHSEQADESSAAQKIAKESVEAPEAPEPSDAKAARKARKKEQAAAQETAKDKKQASADPEQSADCEAAAASAASAPRAQRKSAKRSRGA
eukprot:gnl/TRDRNA2_/TRDRNA2_128023_c0_seq2.p1 gnl/TRDRNA2_/TRDRNA2_128023_c0~~gnl/TRDRNA2_/TRDRNA2_128023_c0_seq2.p1  ORF type:complete len:177 (-),score=51.60 gnl/TRDRNA2_/TRDRNA2_128023_c0_seq2:48-578(-)